ncbi:MAG: DNA primase [Oleiphilaceae bacterium]|nr:DNA primase [Oleiphilaceae bacterium]
MAGQIPQSFIEELRERVPLVDVVSSRIKLKKAGTSYKACCPFHNENTPSFNVNAQKNFYHCFGCGASGDAISFLREYDNLNFVEAVEELAKIAGVEVPRDQRLQQAYDETKPYFEALDAVDRRYREALANHTSKDVAQRYIKMRGLSDEVIERFGIGYAPAERDFVGGQAGDRQLAKLVEMKLVSQKYERPFDLFQNRLMFPIRNMRGKTVGFGGRTLGDDKAKYINSPESRVFHKSNEIYGLFEASRALRSIEKLLVVEGYMDVVSLAQHGINYAVATLGTATNAENLGQLLRRCKKLIFCFDGDAAGMRAAQKAMDNLLPMYENGMQFSFLILPQGEDPDTLIREEGADNFEKRIERALPLSEFFFQVHTQGLNLDLPEDRGVLRSRVQEILNDLPKSALKSGLWDRLKELTSPRKKFSESGRQVTRESSEIRVIRTKDIAICLGLYFAPERHQALNDLDITFQSETAAMFVGFITKFKIMSQQDLMYQLAVDQQGYRERFFDLFSGIEAIPEPDIAIEELDFIIKRAIEQKKRVDALRAAKLITSPDQLTDEERSQAQAVTTRISEHL